MSGKCNRKRPYRIYIYVSKEELDEIGLRRKMYSRLYSHQHLVECEFTFEFVFCKNIENEEKNEEKWNQKRSRINGLRV